MADRTEPRTSADPHINLMLAALEPASYEALMADATLVTLKLEKRLYKQDERIGAVYFPLTCMVSLLVQPIEGPLVEAATIGREGIVGAAGLMLNETALGTHVVQLPGMAVRIDAEAFAKHLGNRPLRGLVDRHLYALIRQILYGAACNSLHTTEERCARWLLMTHDRAATETFPLTQEFLSHMLSVRRATVNASTGSLKKAGFIRYVRGRVTIADRAGLESVCCACYRATWLAYDNVGIRL
jgi:CRP-like cAMP-binding protein